MHGAWRRKLLVLVLGALGGVTSCVRDDAGNTEPADAAHVAADVDDAAHDTRARDLGIDEPSAEGGNDVSQTSEAGNDVSQTDAAQELGNAPDTSIEAVDASSDASSDHTNGSDGGPIQASCCATGMKLCGDRCVSIDDSRFGCSAVGCRSCDESHSYSTGCMNGTCVVMANCNSALFADCNHTLSDGCETRLDQPMHCGSCTTSCDKCSPSGCTTTCSPPLTDCAGACVDLFNSPTDCGRCANACPLLGTRGYDVRCVSGQCTSKCATGFASCNGMCVDITNDANNCGSCGHACVAPAGGQAYCETGQCHEFCQAGLTRCGDACLSLEFDDANCGGCGHACSGGICQESVCVPANEGVVAAGLGEPESLALDGQYIYFTDTGTNLVQRVAKAGGTPETLATNQYRPYRIAIDDAEVYWTNTLGAAVMHVAKTGGAPAVFEPVMSPSEVAVDATDVYWTTLSQDSRAAIFHRPKLGGTPALLDSAPCACAQAAQPILQADPGLTWVLGRQLTFQAAPGGPITRTDVMAYFSLLYLTPTAARVRDGWVYWSTYAGEIAAKPLSTQTPDFYQPNLGSPPQGGILDLAIDTDYVFGVGRGIFKVRRCGGAVIPVRSGFDGKRIAVDDRYVYWTQSGSIGRSVK